MSKSIDIPEALKAIKDMATMLDPDDDYLTLVAAKDAVAKARAARQKDLEGAHNNLKALSKLYEAAKISSSRPRTVPSAEDHAASLNTFDTSRISLAKNISDLESIAVNRNAELSALKERVRDLENYDPVAEHQKEMDSTALRLTIYKGLGFSPIATNDGSVSKILVGSVTGDMHTFAFPEDQTNVDPELTRRLWAAALPS